MTHPRRAPLFVLIGAFAVALAMGTPAGAATPPRPPASVNIATGAHEGGALSAMAADDDTFYRIGSAGRAVDKVRFVAKFTRLDPADEQLFIDAAISATEPCNGVLELFNYRTGQWVTIFEGVFGPNESDLALPLAANDYVNNSGVAKLRGTCTSGGGDFTLQVDELTAATSSAP